MPCSSAGWFVEQWERESDSRPAFQSERARLKAAWWQEADGKRGEDGEHTKRGKSKSTGGFFLLSFHLSLFETLLLSSKYNSSVYKWEKTKPEAKVNPQPKVITRPRKSCFSIMVFICWWGFDAVFLWIFGGFVMASIWNRVAWSDDPTGTKMSNKNITVRQLLSNIL